MKTKIIYISGNEFFEMNDIRTAFEEVRKTLNLDNTTVLFGVPVDADDSGIMQDETPTETVSNVAEIIPEPVVESVVDTVAEDTDEEIITKSAEETAEPAEMPVKKRGRPRKQEIIEESIAEIADEPVEEIIEVAENTEIADEPVIPVLSILSASNEQESDETDAQTDDIEIISEIDEESVEHIPETNDEEPVNSAEILEEDSEADLEKLLSAMTPLQEDVSQDTATEQIEEDNDDDVSVDATLEQLANEFVETQDKIASESKPASRGKIGKLRNILPFKQSKHKDSGLGDLFGWAGIAANDEDFSVPGFFTNAASKK